jgi:parvulin-like peptidyl-prolyl isomerase
MRRLLVPLFALVLLGSACSTFGTAPAATVDGTEISASSITDEVKAIQGNDAYRKELEKSFSIKGLAGKGTFDAAFIAQVLSLRVYYALIEEDLSDRGIELTKEDLDASRQAMEDQFAFADAWSDFPTSYQDQLIRQNALVEAASKRIIDEIGSDPRAFYSANKDEFAEICISHALAGLQGGKTPAEAQALAQSWYDDIEAGKTTFDEVASEKSEDPGAAQGGGDLGCGSKLTLQFDPVFETAAFKLKRGVVSEPVQTQFGSHLILVRSRTIPSYAEVSDQVTTVMQQAREERQQSYFVEVFCGGDVHVNPRYGTWTTESCEGLAPQVPQIRPPEGPAGTTTTTLPDLGQG